jgi:hypothetical protein
VSDQPRPWRRFKTVYDPAAPEEDRKEWRPTLRFIAKVCKEQGIHLKRVHVHYHPEGEDAIPNTHPFGEAEYWNGVIYLCAWDEDTILHELAHVWTESWHTPKWASVYLSLCEIYMKREDFMESVVDAAAQQPVVRHALKRIYGIQVVVKKKTLKENPQACAQRTTSGHSRS